MLFRHVGSPVCSLLIVALALTLGTRSHHHKPRLSHSAARSAVAKLPLYFEAVQAARGEETAFASRGPGYSLWLRPTGTDVVLSGAAGHEGPEAAGTRPRQAKRTENVVLQTRLVGANPHPKLHGTDPLPGKTNYLLGNDPRQWRTDCPTFARVKYEAVYPGVDLVYYGNQGQLEYDFIVQPGTDPHRIRFRTNGTEPPTLDQNGDLLLRTAGREVRQQKPVLYQDVAGQRRMVEGAYQVAADGEVGFQVGPYDRTRPLIIDPVLGFSTLIGGSGGDGLMDVALDADGNIYATGWTLSPDFPVSAGAPQTRFNNNGQDDAVVFKLNSTGTALVYATYLGGKHLVINFQTIVTVGSDEGTSIAVDGQGNACIAGLTSSTDFPIKDAFQPTMSTSGGTADNFDGFVAKLNAAGNGLIFSTYLGSPAGYDEAKGIAVDASGSIYVAGETVGTGFPVTPGAYKTAPVGHEGFATKLTPGGALVYSTFLGGGSPRAIAVDPAGYAYLAGTVVSVSFPTTTGAFQRTIGGDAEGFVTKLSPDGTAVIYSTYLGGSGKDIPYNLALDTSGNVYVTGETSSSNFPLKNPVQSVNRGGTRDAFITGLNADGSGLIFSTYLGGALFDRGRGIAVADDGAIWVSGATDSTDFVTTPDALQPQNAGLRDVFLTELAPGGGSILYSTYLGGSDNDGGSGTATNGPTIALDRSGGLVVGSLTHSPNFPLQSPLQSTRSGAYDCFITRLHWKAPVAPSAAQAAPASPTEIVLTWSDVSDNESGFKVQRRSGAGDYEQVTVTNANVRSFRDTGLQPDTSYTYRVIAFNAVGDSSASTEATGTTPRVPPAAPSGLTATAAGPRLVNLAWSDHSTDEDSFEVERATGAGSFIPVGAAGANTTAYADSTVQPNTTYTYRVRSAAGGVGSTYAVSAPTSTPPDPPAAPTNLAAIDVRDTQVTLSWTASSGATSYNVRRSTASGGTFAPVGTSATAGYTDTTVANAATYYYVVTAVNAGGESPNSNTTAAVQTGYTVSGKVTVGGTGVEGVRVSGGATSVLTAADGTYTLHGFPAGSFGIYATTSSYSFPPQVASLGPSQSSVDFSAPAGTDIGVGGSYSVSGTVTVGGMGVGGVRVSGGPDAVLTAADGSYTLHGFSAGNFGIYATTSSYSFPAQVVSLGPGKTGVNFTAPAGTDIGVGGTYSVSGRVTVGSMGAGGVRVSGGSDTTLTAADGSYTLGGFSAGNFGIYATTPNYTFPPQVVSLGPSRSGVDFAAPEGTDTGLGSTYSVSGTVTVGGVGMGGVLVSGGADATLTAADGSYTLHGFSAGNFGVYATSPNYTFPAQIVSLGPSKTGVDFAAPANALAAALSRLATRDADPALAAVGLLTGIESVAGSACAERAEQWTGTSSRVWRTGTSSGIPSWERFLSRENAPAQPKTALAQECRSEMRPTGCALPRAIVWSARTRDT